MEQPATLFVRIGGMPAVNAAVDIFYKKVLADETVAHFFANIPMHAQSGKLKAFLAYAFGAPLDYAGKNMRAAHAHMHINEAQFNAVAGHLVATLHELAVPQNLVDEVVAIAMGTEGGCDECVGGVVSACPVLIDLHHLKRVVQRNCARHVLQTFQFLTTITSASRMSSLSLMHPCCITLIISSF